MTSLSVEMLGVAASKILIFEMNVVCMKDICSVATLLIFRVSKEQYRVARNKRQAYLEDYHVPRKLECEALLSRQPRGTRRSIKFT